MVKHKKINYTVSMGNFHVCKITWNWLKTYQWI